MKKLFFLLPVLALVMAACSNEFEVAAPWKEIPIAFGILSPKDTAHYIRVEKAFLDPETSALEIAQIADSLYYPENAITVWLERSSTQTRAQLQRVDGALEGYPREGGIFATQPNWLYKFKPQAGSNLVPGEKYRLIIERLDEQPDVTAETTIPDDFAFVKPNPAQLPPRLSFFPNSLTAIEWRCDGNSVLFNIIFTVRYREESANGTVIGRDTLYWTPTLVLDLTLLSNDFYRGLSQISGREFYRFLSENIQPSTDRFRFFENMDITLTGGGVEIKEFLLTASANSGLTGAEVISSYTNLSEGFGLFSSKNTGILGNIKITSETVDSMKFSSLTNTLNFQ